MFSKEEIERMKRHTSLPELAGSYGFELAERGYSRTSLKMKYHGSTIIVAIRESPSPSSAPAPEHWRRGSG